MAKIFSTEDGKLNTSVRLTSERLYTDFDLVFEKKTSTDGDIFKKTDAGAVKQAIKTLLLTNRFEKPYRPQFGADLYSLLFSLADEESGEEISSAITEAIERYEPRVAVQRLQVSATPDYSTVDVTIEFRVINTQLIDTLRLSITDQIAGPDRGVVVPVTVADIPQQVIKTEYDNRILSEFGLYLSRDIGKTIDGAILTQDGDEIAFADTSGNVLIISTPS